MPIQGSGAAEARTARSGHRRDLRSRQDGAAEAKAYGEADFERMRSEHGYAGGYTVVKDYVRIARTHACA
jgi:hypothetical protein